MAFEIINSAGEIDEFKNIIENAIYETNWDNDE